MARKTAPQAHPGEPHDRGTGQRLNWLRAGVLGANDGIVSTAAVVVGVAGATAEVMPVLLAGSAALVGGAISMALGEYVSVSTQRDSEKALIAKESFELEQFPEQEFAELVGLYRQQGLSRETATRVAHELTAHDALGTHLQVELGIDPEELTSPWQAAAASAVAFTLGAVLPVLAMLLAPLGWRIPATFGVVLVALALTGMASARLGGAPRGRAVARLVVGGGLGMALTYAIGSLVGLGGA